MIMYFLVRKGFILNSVFRNTLVESVFEAPALVIFNCGTLESIPGLNSALVCMGGGLSFSGVILYTGLHRKRNIFINRDLETKDT